MRGLNEITSRNARLALERASKDAERRGERLGLTEIARRMSALMIRPEGPGREKHGERRDPASVQRQLRRYLDHPERNVWRLDYLEAFAQALGVPVGRLIAFNYDQVKASEEPAQLLSDALGRRLEPEDAAITLGNLSRELEQPGLFDLMNRIAEALLDTDEQMAAAGTVATLVGDAREVYTAKGLKRKVRPVRR